jgi:hypothetical protein
MAREIKIALTQWKTFEEDDSFNTEAYIIINEDLNADIEHLPAWKECAIAGELWHQQRNILDHHRYVIHELSIFASHLNTLFVSRGELYALWRATSLTSKTA